jgi:ferric-dicitrate binding protein FerR (iron transport regulator)
MPLAMISESLRELETPPDGVSRSKVAVRAAARIQATRWLVELDTTECLDEVWPAFAAWLDEHPIHREMYLRAERTRLAIDNLGRLCPEEGSKAAERLLSPLMYGAYRRRSRVSSTRWIVVTSSVLITVLVIFMLAR